MSNQKKCYTNHLFTLLNQIEDILSSDKLVQGITRFGSWAKGTQDNWSDMDLIVVAHSHQCFAKIFDNLRQLKSILYHAPLEFKPEPVGSHVLGIVFVDEHPFHCLDLNFLIEADNTPAVLQRFGVLQAQFIRQSSAQAENCEDPLEGLFEQSITDRDIGSALHFTKKTTKRFLRGQGTREDALMNLERLRTIMSQYDEDIQVSNGQIGLLVRQYLNFCTSVLTK